MPTPEQERGFAALLDVVIPPDAARGMPGAGELGLAAAIARENEALLPIIASALERLDALARDEGAVGFLAVPEDAREPLVRALDAADPGVLPGLLFQTYNLYYQHPTVLEGLGLPPRPPHPQGYETEPGDLSRLQAVRARGRLWREV